MLLQQISPNDPLTAIVVEGLLKSAPILRDVQFYSKSGSADSVKKANGGSLTSIFRTLNQSNTAVAPEPEHVTVPKKIVSFDAKVDATLEDRNEDPETELAIETRLEAEEAGFILQEKIFEGDADSQPVEFSGIRKLAPNVSAVSPDGLIVPLGNSDTAVAQQQTAVEELLKVFASVRGGATHAYMNEYLKIRWLSVAKNLGYYSQSKDELGDTVEKIGNVVIRGAGYKSDGTPLLPFSEMTGSAFNCSSIFAVRWSERVNLTALTSVGVKARYAGQQGNFLVNNVNFDMALVLQNDNAIVQSSGWALE